MSALGAGVGKAVGGLGGPQIAAIVVGAGLVVGVVAGGVVTGGGPGRPATNAAALAIYPCPDSGPALANVGSGQRFLVTGKTADASWVRIYYPLPGRTEAWVTLGPLQIDGSLASVPVVPCSPVAAAPGASVEPGSSLTAIQDNSPSPPASEAPPTQGPTPPPNRPPTLAALVAAPGSIAAGPARYCPNTARSVSFSVKADDRDDVAGVVLSYRRPGASTFVNKPMTRARGSDTWQATIGTDADGISDPGSLRYFVSATDASRASRTARLPSSGSRSLTVADCANKGPVLASFKAAPNPVYTNNDACQGRPRTTTISVNAKDVDGVTGMTLHYRLPGEGSFRDKPMAKSGSTWRATVTPVDQRPNADGKVSYFVTGKDELGKSTRSDTRAVSVNRCNFPTDFGSVNWDAKPVCSSQSTAFVSIARASDGDGLTASSGKIVYSWTPKGKARRTGRANLTQTDTSGNFHYYQGQVNLTNLEPGSSVSMHATLTDAFGNTAREPGFTFQVPAGC